MRGVLDVRLVMLCCTATCTAQQVERCPWHSSCDASTESWEVSLTFVLRCCTVTCTAHKIEGRCPGRLVLRCCTVTCQWRWSQWWNAPRNASCGYLVMSLLVLYFAMSRWINALHLLLSTSLPFLIWLVVCVRERERERLTDKVTSVLYASFNTDTDTHRHTQINICVWWEKDLFVCLLKAYFSQAEQAWSSN